MPTREEIRVYCLGDCTTETCPFGVECPPILTRDQTDTPCEHCKSKREEIGEVYQVMLKIQDGWVGGYLEDSEGNTLSLPHHIKKGDRYFIIAPKE